MKIWWCQEHECSGEDVSCVYSHWNEAEGRMANMPPCRMVPMRLIPDNDEALERAAKALCDWDDDDGHLHDERYREGYRQGVRIVLAALDGETP